MLSRVQIKDYRCLREVDAPLKPLTVLIGPNNTGKSAFLSAIQLLATVTQNSKSAIDHNDLWSFDPTSSPSITGYTREGEELRVERGPVERLVEQRNHWVSSGDNLFVAPLNFFGTSVFAPAMQSSGTSGDAGIPRIDDNASNTPAFMDALLRKDRDRFFTVLDILRKLVPGLADLNIDTPSSQNRRIDLVFENGMVMDAKLASFGVKLLIFFVSLASHPDPPRTILVEEPETGFHPKRLDDIVDLLIGLSEGRFAKRQTQVILTTHSPYLLDCVAPEKHQVLVFKRQSDGSCTAKPVDTERLKVFMDEFMLGEVWLNQEESGLVEK